MTNQSKLFDLPTSRTSYGGNKVIGKRRMQRPFVRKKPIHVVLRSSAAKGELSFLKRKNEHLVHKILHAQSKRHLVQLLEYVNVGNHLHIKIKAYSREGFQAFLKSSTALIARAITGAKKGHAFGKFWDALAFTRILTSWGEEKILDKYFTKNAFEAVHGTNMRSIIKKKKKKMGFG